MISLVSLLKEIYNKELKGKKYGEGGQHRIHQYDTDKILKRPHKKGNELGDNVKIFSKYPNIFPKIYDMGKDYAIIEKLDDSKSQKELWDIKKTLFSKNGNSISSEDSPNNSYISSLSQNIRDDGTKFFRSDITQLIYNNINDNELKNQFKKELSNNLYLSLITNYYPLLIKIKELPWDSQIEKDINDENFGYNSKNELRMLDI